MESLTSVIRLKSIFGLDISVKIFSVVIDACSTGKARKKVYALTQLFHVY